MAVFDVAAFENQIIEQENATKTTPLPVGDYTTVIDKVKVDSVKGKDGSESPVLRVTHKFLNLTKEIEDLMGREDVLRDQTIWLDVNEKNGLDFGPNKNVQLGRLREACGLNTPKPFTFRQLVGKGPLAVTIDHTTKDDNTYDKIVKVVAKK